MHLCNIPPDRIHAVEIPTGLPLVYDARLQKIRLLQEVAYPHNHNHNSQHHHHGGHRSHEANHSSGGGTQLREGGAAHNASAPTIISGNALLQKYNFGDDPGLLFALDQVDVPLEVEERQQ